MVPLLAQNYLHTDTPQHTHTHTHTQRSLPASLYSCVRHLRRCPVPTDITPLKQRLLWRLPSTAHPVTPVLTSPLSPASRAPSLVTAPAELEFGVGVASTQLHPRLNCVHMHRETTHRFFPLDVSLGQPMLPRLEAQAPCPITSVDWHPLQDDLLM